MRTSSKIDFLNKRQTAVLHSLKKYPDGMSTNVLFEEIKESMSKYSFIKTLNELEEFTVIERFKLKNRKIIRLSSFLKFKEEILNKQRKALKQVLQDIVKQTKGMSKKKRNEFLFKELTKFSLIVSEFIGMWMISNSSFFKDDKILAWANLGVFGMLREVEREMNKVLRQELDRPSQIEFYKHQSKEFEKYVLKKVNCVEKMKKGQGRKKRVSAKPKPKPQAGISS